MKLFSVACTSTARLDGKTAVITGASGGIGRYTAQNFYTRGARVVMACRNLEKAHQVVTAIENSCKHLKNLGTLLVVQLDLISLKSVRDCANNLLKNEDRIHLLINNAGALIRTQGKTEDGFELNMGTNHLGHFLFTLLLLPRIIQSAPARIVNVSSFAHLGFRIDLQDLNFERKRYGAVRCYQQSKLANILFAKELARRLKEKGISDVTTYSLHPGCIQTNLVDEVESLFGIFSFFFRYVVRRFLKTPQQGAQTTIYCAIDEKCANESGLYYSECSVTTPYSTALHENDARGLWDLSWKLVGLDDHYDPFANSIRF